MLVNPNGLKYLNILRYGWDFDSKYHVDALFSNSQVSFLASIFFSFKNKDGLLYVEVQFDTKTEESNPVIHGDDEKTDYATVEFPMPSSSHDRE